MNSFAQSCINELEDKQSVEHLALYALQNIVLSSSHFLHFRAQKSACFFHMLYGIMVLKDQ